MPIYRINTPFKEKVFMVLGLLIASILCIGETYYTLTHQGTTSFQVLMLAFGAVLMSGIYLRLYANVFGRFNLHTTKDEIHLIISCFSLIFEALIIIGYFFGAINEYCKSEIWTVLLLYITAFGFINARILWRLPIIVFPFG